MSSVSDFPPDMPPSDWELLNAYVDGALAPAAAAEIAARISREPALAQRAAALTRMKASAAAAFEADGFVPALPDGVNAGTDNVTTTWSRFRHAILAAAAAITLLVATAVTLLPRPGDDDPAWLVAAAAAAQHATMSAQTAPAAPTVSRIAALAGFHPYIPDLAAAQLHPVAAASFRFAGATLPGLALHFRGMRGCRVSYFAFTLPDGAAQPGEALDAVESAGVGGYGWRVGDIGYLLLARGMDPARLTTLARTIHAASRQHRPLDDAARTLLAQSRAKSRACVA